MTPLIRINTELILRRRAAMVSVTSARHSTVDTYRNPQLLTEPVVENHQMCAISTEPHPACSDTSGSSSHRKHMLPNKLWQTSLTDAVWHNFCYEDVIQLWSTISQN